MSNPSTRRFERHTVNLWAAEHEADAVYYHEVSNLSLGGVFLRKKVPLPVGHRIALEFTLPSGETVWAEGVTVHSGNTGIQGNGIEFDKIQLAHQTALERFLSDD